MKKALWLAPATLIVALILAVTTSVGAQADIKVTSVTISPDSVKEGETVTITATVTNTGDAPGSHTLVLKIDDEVEATKEIVDLAADGSQTVTFTVAKDVAGDYIVDVNGRPGYFTVTRSFWDVFPPYLWVIVGGIVSVLVLFIIVLAAIPPRKQQAGAVPKTRGTGRRGPLPAAPTPTPTPAPTPFPTPTPMPTAGPTPTAFPPPGPMAAPRAAPTARAAFSVSNLTITPNQVKEGESVTISAIVANNGTESSKYSVVLRIGGVVEGITELTLAPGASQPAIFTVTKDAGNYYAELDGLAGTFSVIALIPAHFSVSNLVIAPDRVKQGDSITVSAAATNTGEVAGTYSVVLKVKGVAESIEEVSLGPGRSQRVAFTVTKDTPGFYQVDLEGLSGRFVVEMEWNE